MSNTTRLSVFMLLLGTLLAIPAWSAPRDKTEMKRCATAALRHLSASDGRREMPATVVELLSTDAYSIYGPLQGGGFAMIASDDRLPAVLAISETTFSPLTINPGFEWYCNSIKELAAVTSGLGNIVMTTTLPDPDKYPSHVEPLILTRWGQQGPYSYWCPTVTGELCEDYMPDVNHCYVGCVATALAQICRYYRYPASASGTCGFMIGDQNVTIDFAGQYDWDNMLDDYTGQYTEAQGRAAAMLSYHCGLVSRMDYGSNASGTSNEAALIGAQQYFGYSKDAHIVVRSNYDEPSWMDMVYNELSHGRPLYYQGLHMNSNPLGEGGLGLAGHSFVIDGYDEQGMVHVNWGWYGEYNGYFDIALLDVRGLHFNAYQDMVVGFMPEPSEQQLWGDVDADGRLSIGDVTALTDYLLSRDGTGINLDNADVDRDGDISIGDVVALIDLLLAKGH